MAIPNDPNTREEHYLASMAGQKVDLPQPIPRIEKYLAKAAGMDVETPDPLTRVERYLDVIAESGGSSVTVEPLVVTANGTTTAPSGKAYSPVTVNVPTPTPSLQSKSVTVTQNGTQSITPDSGYDGLSSVAVTTNVPNPNYVETITGTLDNPFGTMTTTEIQSLIDSLMANEVTLVLDFTATFLGKVYYIRTAATQAVNNSGSVLSRIAFDVFKTASSGWFGFYIAYRVNQGRLVAQTSVYFAEADDETLYGSVSLEDFLNDATVSATTMTIIHHPLPSNG